MKFNRRDDEHSRPMPAASQTSASLVELKTADRLLPQEFNGHGKSGKEQRHGDGDVAICAAMILPGIAADVYAVSQLSQDDSEQQRHLPVAAEEIDG